MVYVLYLYLHTNIMKKVSFLVVTRANITYARYMESRQYLTDCYRTCREIVQHTCILTLFENSAGAQEWRQEVAYRTILLLRITMAAIEVSKIVVILCDVLLLLLCILLIHYYNTTLLLYSLLLHYNTSVPLFFY